MLKTKNSKAFSIVLIILDIACVAGLIIFFMLSNMPTEVPELTGMTLMEAEEAGQEAGLTVKDGHMEDSENVEEGLIIRQYPVAGIKAKAGDIILVTVSRGLGDGRTPDVTGMSTDDAKAAIEKAGFKLGNINAIEGVEAAGTVKSQDPKGDKELRKGSAISIDVSDGTMTTVPNLIGKEYSVAFELLRKASLTSMSHAHDEVFSDTVEMLHVVSQSIAPGTVVKKETYVSFVISMGPKPDDEDE